LGIFKSTAFPSHDPDIQVHDELDISVINDLEAAKIKDIMENAVDLKIPNKVDYEFGPNWGEING